MKPHRMDHIMAILKKEAAKFATPVVGVIAEETKDPYCVLISCIGCSPDVEWIFMM